MDNKLTILAVDDNSISLATIEQEFKGSYEVVALNSGIRALQYLKPTRNGERAFSTPTGRR